MIQRDYFSHDIPGYGTSSRSSIRRATAIESRARTSAGTPIRTVTPPRRSTACSWTPRATGRTSSDGRGRPSASAPTRAPTGRRCGRCCSRTSADRPRRRPPSRPPRRHRNRSPGHPEAHAQADTETDPDADAHTDPGSDPAAGRAASAGRRRQRHGPGWRQRRRPSPATAATGTGNDRHGPAGRRVAGTRRPARSDRRRRDRPLLRRLIEAGWVLARCGPSSDCPRPHRTATVRSGPHHTRTEASMTALLTRLLDAPDNGTSRRDHPRGTRPDQGLPARRDHRRTPCAASS